MTTNKKQHPNKHINDVVQYAVDKGWELKDSSGHPWGKLYCPYKDSPCENTGAWCITSVWGTPGKPQNHAKQLKRLIDRCIKAQEV